MLFAEKVNAMPDKKITAFEKSGIILESRSSAAHIQIAQTQIKTESFVMSGKLTVISLIPKNIAGKRVPAV